MAAEKFGDERDYVPVHFAPAMDAFELRVSEEAYAMLGPGRRIAVCFYVDDRGKMTMATSVTDRAVIVDHPELN